MLTFLVLLFSVIISYSPDCYSSQRTSGTVVENTIKNLFYVDYNNAEDAEVEKKSSKDSPLTSRSTRKRHRTTATTTKTTTPPINGIELLAPNWSSVNHEDYRSNEYRLTRHLFRYYDRRIRPVPRNAKKVNITFGLALSQIIDVDEKNQQITTNCWLNTAWLDFQLSWNPQQWDGIDILRVPYNLVWLPDVLLYNSADMMTYFSSLSTNVILQANGNVTWLNMIIYKSTCSIDVRYFPFDIQNCTLEFSSWTYDGTLLGIQTVSEEGDLSNFIENTEWQLVKYYCRVEIKIFSCCPDEPYPFITYFLIMKRRPLYYVYNLFLPCILITLVALLGFYVPADSGEKVSMGITTLLSMTVFLMVVADSMPPTKTHVPLLGLYFGFTIVVVSCATGLTVFTLNIHHTGKQGIRMPKYLRFIIFKILGTLVFLPTSLKADRNNPGESFKQGALTKKKTSTLMTSLGSISTRDQSESPLYSPFTSTSEIQSSFLSRGNRRCYSEIKTHQERALSNLAMDMKKLLGIQEKQRTDLLAKQAIEEEWQQASIVIDRISLAVFLSVTVGVTAVTLVYSFNDNFN